MTWLVTRPKAGELASHIIPVEDDREHVASLSCWCRPQMDEDTSEFMWLHSALDGREGHEGPYGKPLH